MDEELMKDDPVFQQAKVWADAMNNMNPKIAKAILKEQKNERKDN